MIFTVSLSRSLRVVSGHTEEQPAPPLVTCSRFSSDPNPSPPSRSCWVSTKGGPAPDGRCLSVPSFFLGDFSTCYFHLTTSHSLSRPWQQTGPTGQWQRSLISSRTRYGDECGRHQGAGLFQGGLCGEIRKLRMAGQGWDCPVSWQCIPVTPRSERLLNVRGPGVGGALRLWSPWGPGPPGWPTPPSAWGCCLPCNSPSLSWCCRRQFTWGTPEGG